MVFEKIYKTFFGFGDWINNNWKNGLTAIKEGIQGLISIISGGIR